MTGLQPGAATMTVLFTDLVDSTAMRSRLGDDQADEVRREHDDLIARLVDENRGSIVKGLGDGIMAVFGAPSAGIAAAVGIQQAIARRNRQAKVPIALRMGLSVGEVRVEADDVYGTPVVEASRLCSAAGADQILAAEHVKLLAGSRSTATFRAFGELELKGLGEPLRTLEVLWWEASDAPTVPFPEIPTLTKPTDAVGRRVERYAIGHAFLNARTAKAPVVFVSGADGVGKTRLMAEFAQRTTQNEGGMVLYGRCSEHGAAPFQPFIEALRYYVENVPSGQLGDLLGSFTGELTRLVPDLRERVPGATLAPVSTADPDLASLRLFDAVAGWLVAASRDEPVVLLLDDMQWASGATLELLRHVVDSPTPMRVLVVAGYRDTDLAADHPLHQLADHLRRSDHGVEPIRLQGLSEDDVAILIDRLVGDLGEAAPALAARIHAVSAGNPLFVIELVRFLEANQKLQGGDAPRLDGAAEALVLPPTVEDTLRARTAVLGDDVLAVLQSAAIVGDEFDLSVVRAVGELGDDEFTAAIDAATAAGLVAEAPGSRFRYAFAHPSGATALAATVDPERQARLHRQVAEALREGAGADDRHAAEIAGHELAAVAGGQGDREQAIQAGVLAGDRARDQLAYEEAVSWYGQAVDLLGESAATQLDLLIGLGQAQALAGSHAAARETLLRVAALAREAGDGPHLVMAALTESGTFTGRSGPFDTDRVEILRAALEADGTSLADTALLKAALAFELRGADHAEERNALAGDALGAARQLGTADILAAVLQRRLPTIAGNATLAERITLSEELFDLAGQLEDPLLRFHAALQRARAAAEGADLEQHDHWLGLAGVVASDLDLDVPSWLVSSARASRAFLAGDLAAAERHADAARQSGTEAGHPDAERVHLLTMLAVRQQQGRIDELASGLDPVSSSAGSDAYALLRAIADAGRLQEIAPWYRSAIAAGLPDANEPTGHAALANLGYLAALLGDVANAGLLYERLEPWADRFAVTDIFQHVGAHELGMLAATTERTDDANRWFAKAIEVHEDVPAPLFAAETRLEWARVRFATDEVDRARELIGQALAASAKGNAAGIEGQARTLLTAAFGGLDDTAAPGEPAAAAPEPEPPGVPVAPVAVVGVPPVPPASGVVPPAPPVPPVPAGPIVSPPMPPVPGPGQVPLVPAAAAPPVPPPVPPPPGIAPVPPPPPPMAPGVPGQPVGAPGGAVPPVPAMAPPPPPPPGPPGMVPPPPVPTGPPGMAAPPGMTPPPPPPGAPGMAPPPPAPPGPPPGQPGMALPPPAPPGQPGVAPHPPAPLGPPPGQPGMAPPPPPGQPGMAPPPPTPPGPPPGPPGLAPRPPAPPGPPPGPPGMAPRPPAPPGPPPGPGMTPTPPPPPPGAPGMAPPPPAPPGPPPGPPGIAPPPPAPPGPPPGPPGMAPPPPAPPGPPGPPPPSGPPGMAPPPPGMAPPPFAPPGPPPGPPAVAQGMGPALPPADMAASFAPPSGPPPGPPGMAPPPPPPGPPPGPPGMAPPPPPPPQGPPPAPPGQGAPPPPPPPAQGPPPPPPPPPRQG